MMHRKTIWLALFLVLVAQPALADEEFTEINLMAGFQSSHVADNTIDLFDSNDWLTPGTIAAEVELYRGLFLQLGVAMVTQEERLFDKWDSRLSITEPRLGVRYGYTFFEAIRPYASLAVTYALVDTTLDLWDEERVGHEDNWKEGEWGGRLALGCELFLPRHLLRSNRSGFFKDFTFGVAVEGGYALKEAVALDDWGHGVDGDFGEETPLPAGTLDVGELDLSGFFVAVDFRVYF